jgi:hypothetical protein
MLAIDPPVRILIEALASEGPSTHTLSGARQERSRNLAYWPKAVDGAAVGPDAIAGQGDVLPSERRDVCEEITGDDGSLRSSWRR